MMKSTLTDIQKHFQRRSFLGIESIRQAVAPRVFHALGWDIWNPREVWRDFQPLADLERKLDFALCLPAGLPVAFVIVVPQGQLQNPHSTDSIGSVARRFNGIHTASFYVLTDGVIWRFFSIAKDYHTPSMCFAAVDLRQDDYLDMEVTFRKFLQKSAVQSGSAIREVMAACGLSGFELQEGAELPEVPVGSSYQKPHLLGHYAPDDFTYTAIHDCRFAGTRCFNWNELIRFAIGFAYQSGIPVSQLQSHGIVVSANQREKSFYPIPGTSLWLQTMDAKYAWSRTLAIAKLLNVGVSVHFRWHNVVGLPRRQEYGLFWWEPEEL